MDLDVPTFRTRATLAILLAAAVLTGCSSESTSPLEPFSIPAVNANVDSVRRTAVPTIPWAQTAPATTVPTIPWANVAPATAVPTIPWAKPAPSTAVPTIPWA